MDRNKSRNLEKFPLNKNGVDDMTEGLNNLLTTVAKLLAVLVLLLITGSTAQAKQLTALNTLEGNQNQYVTVKFNDEPLADALLKLTRQVKVGISYSTQMVPDKRITYQAENEDIYQVLNDILEGTRLFVTLSSNRKVILIKEKPMERFKYQETVTGIVTDANTGEPLPGVNIAIKGTKRGTSTDVDGKFSLTVENLEETLIFSFIGYQRKEEPIQGRTSINISLQPELFTTSELVVVAYGLVEKSDLIGSVGVLSSEDFQNAPRENVVQSLQGNISGLNVSRAQGQPGSPESIHVRGVGSINASSGPLFVVDGVPMETSSGISYGSYGGFTTSGLAGINPDDISTVTILKDAEATSIYGSRAANGVIIIETKRGQSGKPEFNISYQHGITSMTEQNRNKPLNTDEMLELLREGWVNDGRNPADFDAAMQAQGIDPNQSTDWLGELTQPGRLDKITVSASGGTENTQYYVSGGFYSQDALIKDLNYKRGTTQIRLNLKPMERLSLETNLRGSMQQTQNAQRLSNWLASPVRHIYRTQPWIPIYNPDGSYNFNFATTYNPMAEIKETKHIGSVYNVRGTFGAVLDLFEGLTFESKEDFDLNYGETDMFFPGGFGWGRNTNGRGYFSTQLRNSWTASNLLRYRNTFQNQHALETFVGYEAQHFRTTGSDAIGNDFIPNLQTLGAASTPTSVNTIDRENSLVGMFLRVNYDFEKKLYLNGSVRRDGSSRFGAKRRYANFWSVGLGWDIHNTFIKDISTISILRLKASYGVNGNEDIGNYASRGLYGSQTYSDHGGYYFTQYANPLLTWEQNKPFNIGLNFGFLKERIMGSLDYYKRTTDRLILERPIPATSGLNSYSVNFGAMQNSGLEFTLSTKNIVSEKFYWTTDFNISTLKNEVTKLDDNVISNFYMVEKGSNYYTWYLPAYAGVDKNTGEKLWYTNEEKSITSTNYSDAVRMKHGNAMPKFFGGITNSLTYDNFRFSFMVYFNWGNKVYNIRGYNTDTDGAQGFNDGAKLSRYTYENRWQNPGDVTDSPKIVFGGPTVQQYSSRWLADGSYIRLRDVSLSYNLPIEWTENFKVKNANVYIQASNLFTYIKDKKLVYDPEVGMNGQVLMDTPTGKTITMGINVSF